MFPLIDTKKTGIRLRRIMDERGFTVKDVQQYLELASVQSVYHWLNGQSMPTIDNLYALSELFRMPIDDMICGNRRKVMENRAYSKIKHLHVYYEKLQEHKVA